MRNFQIYYFGILTKLEYNLTKYFSKSILCLPHQGVRKIVYRTYHMQAELGYFTLYSDGKELGYFTLYSFERRKTKKERKNNKIVRRHPYGGVKKNMAPFTLHSDGKKP